MRAVQIERFGEPGGMVVVDRPAPVPAQGEVVVRTEAIGVGGVDAMIRRGTLGGYGFEPGLVPGSEVAGTVSSVGAGVDEAWVGRRVWAFTGTGGGYAESATARVQDVVALPAGLSSVDAVTIGSAGPVAHFALEHARLVRGESVLVRGAAGSIGIAAVELAARAGADAVAITTSSPARGDRLRGFGATHVLDREGSGDAESPEAYDVIIDVVGGAGLPAFVDRLARNGRYVVVGMVAGLPPTDFGMRLVSTFQQSRSVATFSLDSVPTTSRDAVREASFEDVLRGDLHAVVHQVLALGRAVDAHRQMDAGTVFGRIVLTP